MEQSKASSVNLSGSTKPIQAILVPKAIEKLLNQRK